MRGPHPPKEAAFFNTLRMTRSWLTGEPMEQDFPFVLPCANWKKEEEKCAGCKAASGRD